MPQQTDRTIYVGSVGKEVDEPALLALFGHCGTVTQIRIAGDPSYDTRYAFIEFTAPEEAQVALFLDGMAVFDRTIKVSMARGGAGPGVVRSNDPDRVQRTVHVGGLPMEELSETVLADFFQNVGEVLAVRKSGRFAWVEFTSIQAAHQALTLDGELLGSNMLKISQSKTPIHTAGWRAPPKGQQPARPDLMSLAAQRIQQPLSPSLLTSNPLLASAAFGQAPFGAYAHAAAPPLRPDYSTQLPPLYDHVQQQQPAHNGYGTHAHYLPNNMAPFGYSAASLADISSFSGAIGQPVQLPSLGQYGQPSDAPHNPYSPAIHSNQAQIPSQPETYYSQGALPGSSSVTLPYSQAYPSVPGGGSFFS